MYKLCKRVIEMKNPYVNFDELRVLLMNFVSDGRLTDVEYNELVGMMDTAGL